MLSFFRSAWAKFKQLDHYRRAVLCILPVAGILLLVVLIINPSDLLLVDWFLDIITIPAFISNLISIATYLGRFAELAHLGFLKWYRGVQFSSPSVSLAERLGTLFGVLLGLGVGITLAVMSVTVPFARSLFFVAKILFLLNHMSRFAGLGNRIGNFFTDTRPKSERFLIAGAMLLGLGIGIALFATSTTAMVSVIGITTFATGGFALPLWALGFIFICSFTSSIGSFADYTSKSISFVRAQFQNDAPLRTYIEERFHEYRGSLVGACTGLAIGAMIMTVLAVTQPHLFAGLVGVVAAAFILTTCISLMGGFFGRVGRAMDGWFKPLPVETPEEKKTWVRCHPRAVRHPRVSKDDGLYRDDERRRDVRLQTTRHYARFFAHQKTQPTGNTSKLMLKSSHHEKIQLAAHRR